MNAPFEHAGITAIAAVEQTALFLHCAIFLDGNDIVSDETFRLLSINGQESVSEPFEYNLELRANSGSGRAFQFDQFIGKPITFAIGLPTPEQQNDPTAIVESSQRFADAVNNRGGDTSGLSYFNGIVASFAMGAPGIYQLVVRPALWKLTLANRYTLYDDMTIRTVINRLLSMHDINPNTSAVGGLALARTQDWLQAGESDYEFLRRLMGKAHIYFYFRHGPRSHTVVFANRPDYPEAIPGRQLRYTFTDNREGGMTQFDVIGDYRYQQNLHISAVHTVFTRQDEAWQVDGIAGVHGFTAAKPDAKDDGRVFRQHKVFQYGSGRSAAEQFASLTEQASRTSASQLSGESFCPYFRAGHRFSMTEDVMADSAPMPVRPSLNKAPFVLTKVEHEASLDGTYKNRFEATEAEGLVSAFSLADTQQGSVLAIVVDHESPANTPDTWKYLEKTDFDPAVHSYSDKESEDQPALQAQGVYVRLATDPSDARRWVKLSANMQSAPDIGAQVIVGRANDESELPEVQQIVSSVGSKTVTPSTWTANTSVGSNYGTRYGDGINIGFGRTSNADLGKAVSIVTSAYDSGRFRESSYGQGASYSFSTAESRADSASQSLSATYGPYGPVGDLLGVSESFGSNFSRTVGTVQSSIQTFDTTYNKSTATNTENHQVVNGTALSTDTTSIRSSTSNIGVSNSDDTLGVVNSNNLTGLSVQMGITGIGTQTTISGVQDSTSIVGLQTNLGLTGLSDAVQLSGKSTQTSISGVTTQLSVSGMSSNISIAAVENKVSLTPIINEVTLVPVGIKVTISPSEIVVEMPAIELHLVDGLEITL